MKNKKIYINGDMFITTPFFRYSENAGCLYDKAPEGAEKIECNSVIEGHSCLVVDDSNAPSIFNDYYAKGGLTTTSSWAPFLFKSNEDNYKEYKCRVDEIYELAKIVNISSDIQQILFRQVYLGIVASVETFVCDTILSELSNSKESFCKYIDDEYLYSKKDKDSTKEELGRMWNNNEMGNAEQKVFDSILMTSYCNINRIKKRIRIYLGYLLKILMVR